MNRKLLVSLLVALLRILLAIFVNILTGRQSFLKYFTDIGSGALIAFIFLLSILLLLATYLQHQYQHSAVSQGEHADFETSIRSFIARSEERRVGKECRS